MQQPLPEATPLVMQGSVRAFCLRASALGDLEAVGRWLLAMAGALEAADGEQAECLFCRAPFAS